MEGGRHGYKRATWESLVGVKKRCILAVVVDRRTHGTKYTHMHTRMHTRTPNTLKHMHTHACPHTSEEKRKRSNACILVQS